MPTPPENASPETQTALATIIGEHRLFLALLCAAYQELNAVRARDGVPRMFDGTHSGVSEEYFSDLVDAIADAVGGHPWIPKDSQPVLKAALDRVRESDDRSYS